MRKLALLISLLALCYPGRAQQMQITGTGSISGKGTINVGPPMGPLVQSGTNNHFVVNPSGQIVYLTGSHTWSDFDDTSTAAVPAPFPFTNFVSMLKANGHSFTILWHKDLPRECNWQNSSNYNLLNGTQFGPWLRTGPGNATDGLPKFDLSQFNQSFFDRMRSEALTLQQNGIYAAVELFDGNNLTSTRGCGDGFPLTGVNNINGIDDGYVSGTAGVGSVTEASASTNPNLVAIQDAYVKKMIDSLNDLQNVVWEVAEEQPGTSFSGTSGYGGASSMTWWVPHIIELVKTYERGGTCTSCTGGPTFTAKPFHHLVGVGSMNFNDRLSPQGDAVLYASTAEWIAPTVTATAPDTFPSNVATNNQGKLVINDSDHALGASAFVNSSTGVINDTSLRGYVWENYTQQATGLVFMDPYVMSLPVNQRNPCASPVNLVCPAPMTKYDPFRGAMGMTQIMEAQLVNHLAMTTQNSLCSTAFCEANNTATTSEFVVYAPSGGTFTVNLSVQTGRVINVQWLDPTTGALTTGTAVSGGSATASFTPPWGSTHDAVLHLTDGGVISTGLFPNIGWTQMTGTAFSPVVPTYAEVQGATGPSAVFSTWSGGLFDHGSYNRQADRFLHMGGGHNDWYGNEVYQLNVSASPATSLLKDTTHNPDLSLGNDASAINTPTSRHHYNGFLHYFQTDQYFMRGAFLSSGGQSAPGVWFLNPNTLTLNGNDATGWTKATTSGTAPTTNSIPLVAYDNGNETVAPGIYSTDQLVGPSPWYKFQAVNGASANTWTTLSASIGQFCNGATNMRVDIDPIHRFYYCVGAGHFSKIGLDSPFTASDVTGTGCSTLKSAQAPGFTWYGPKRIFVGYAGGNTVYVYDPVADSCTTQTFTGGPTTFQGTNGTWGNFQFDGASGVFVSCNSTSEDCFALRLDSNATQQSADFTARSTAAGVITVRGFDNASDFTIINNNAGGVHVSTGRSSVFPVQDVTTFTSGGSSMLFTIPQQIGQDGSGSWWEIFPQTFGANTTWYVQFRMKVDQNWISMNPKDVTTNPANFKTNILAAYVGTPPNGSPNTCGPTELTTVNWNNRGWPLMYTNCGSPSLEIDMGNGDFLKEQGDNSVFLGAAQDTGFNCHYQQVNNTSQSCAQWPANVWVTYYLKVQLGAVNTSSTCSCNTIQAWRALPGQPYQPWVNLKNFPLQLTAGTTGWNFMEIIPGYATGRDSGTSFGPGPAHVWIDELLVSTAPITWPTGPVN